MIKPQLRRGAALLLAGLLTLAGAAPALAEPAADQQLAQAYAAHRSHLQIEDDGVVLKLLPDDTEGSRHQRFVVQLANGQRLLFAYNIDLAPRIDALQRGDTIAFRGEYIWNRKGGIVHWTHHDPSGRHAGGYIRLNGRVYQ
ncbi:MAG: hypothetical protein JWR16_2737 [Nevskia sp.]|nr:hypothetical protein [Nevskia sp.]